jgi:hypothetical protein
MRRQVAAAIANDVFQLDQFIEFAVRHVSQFRIALKIESWV